MIKSFFKSFKIIFYLSLLLLVYLIYLSRDLPSLERLETFDPAMLSTIYDRNGETIGEFYIQKRVFIDLEDMSTLNSISIDEIIKIHSLTTYSVLSMGFLPGFLYLGVNDKKLYLERKDKPELNIKSGSIGIARDQTGIYPQDSPGGWRIIGRSPISFFNVNDKSPCFAKPGDKIKFQSISFSEFNRIEKRKNSYKIKYEVV